MDLINKTNKVEDVEALELFEAVLGGTNSILKYLDENVK
jgi:hypothetical protein